MKTAICVVHGSLKNYNRWNSLSSSELSTVSIKFRDISQGFFFPQHVCNACRGFFLALFLAFVKSSVWRKQTNYTTESDANDFVNAKSNARKRLLLAAKVQYVRFPFHFLSFNNAKRRNY